MRRRLLSALQEEDWRVPLWRMREDDKKWRKEPYVLNKHRCFSIERLPKSAAEDTESAGSLSPQLSHRSTTLSPQSTPRGTTLRRGPSNEVVHQDFAVSPRGVQKPAKLPPLSHRAETREQSDATEEFQAVVPNKSTPLPLSPRSNRVETERVPDPESPNWSQTLENAFGASAYPIASTAHRGITLKQLCQVLQFIGKHCRRLHDRTRYSAFRGKVLELSFLNLYHINDWIIIPASKGKKCGNWRSCSFVELLAREHQTPVWFVSHWWGERHAHFLQCLEMHAKIRCLTRETPFWVCAYALRQHLLQTEIKQDPRQCSFYNALQVSVGVLLILDDSNEATGTGPCTPFTRSWCAFEEYVALFDLSLLLDIGTMTKGGPLVMTDGITEQERMLEQLEKGQGWVVKRRRESMFPVNLICNALRLSVENTKASRNEDRRSILNCIAHRPLDGEPLEESSHYTQYNQRLRARFCAAAWPVAVVRGIVGRMQFPEVLAAAVGLESLALSFQHFDRVIGPKDVVDIARGLPPGLQKLQLDFTYCTQLTSSCLAKFAKFLQPPMRKLDLCFDLCKQVGDPGLAALGRAFPESLEDLMLSFQGCQSINNGGVAALAKGFPASMRSLQLNLRNCNLISNEGVAAIGQNFGQKLHTLELVLDGLDHERSSNAGVAALFIGLPESLTSLSLDFSGWDIDDNGMGIFTSGLSQELQKLPLKVFKISCCGCGQIGDTGFMALLQGLPSSLQVFEANFAYCEAISDASLWAIGQHLPDGMKELCLCVDGCSHLRDPGIATLAHKLPAGLQKLQLRLAGCSQIGSGAVAAVLKLASSLTALKLDVAKTAVSKDVQRACKTDIHSLRKLKLGAAPAEPGPEYKVPVPVICVLPAEPAEPYT